jgi:hypothetical protein
MAAQKSKSPAMEFLVSSLKANRKAVYADLKAKADAKGLKLFPIMFGRAQLTLGIVKAGKGRTKALAAKKANAATTRTGTGQRGRQPDANSKSGKIRELLVTGMSVRDIAKKVGCTTALVYNVKGRAGGRVKRGPGRPANIKSSAGASLSGLAGIFDMVKNSDRERTQLRSALEKIQAVIAVALA